MPTDPAPKPPPPNRPMPMRALPRRRFRRRVLTARWTIRVLVGTPLLVIGIALILMRSPMVGRLVAEQVRRLTGGEWRADRTAIMLNGQLVVSGLHLRVPGLEGEEGEVLSARQAVADVDWTRLPPLSWFRAKGGAPGSVIGTLRLTAPVFRLSQSTVDNSLNIAGLTPPPSTGGNAPLPRIDVIEGRIELTEHTPPDGTGTPAVFARLNTVPIAGALIPDPSGRPAFTARLQEIGRAPSVRGEQRGMILDGRVDLVTNEVVIRLLNFSLDDWPAETVPAGFRDTWRKLAVQGKVSEATLDYSPGREGRITVKLDDVGIVVPVPAEEPREGENYLGLYNVHGSVTLARTGVAADLRGHLRDQQGESHVVLTTTGIDFDSGFRCEFSSRQLHVSETTEFLPYIPRIARQYLEWFGGPTAIVDASVVLQRAEPVGGAPAPISVPEGRLSFTNGTAAFHKFPYPFHGMSAEASFDDRTIRIIRVTGFGPSGAPMSASGLITPLDANASVDLTIDVDKVPVDDDLLAAMQPSRRRLVEVLFSREGYADLVRHGFVRAPGAGGGGGGKAQEFELGGLATVQVRVRRPRGDGVKWTTDVLVDFPRAGLVPEPFPFPILASNMRLRIDDDKAVFEGGEFRGLRGGRAEVSARVDFGEKPDAPMEPDVRITGVDLPVDDLLLNAVPGSDQVAEGGAEGAAGEQALNANAILKRFDLRGKVDCRVSLRGPEGAPSPGELVGPPRDLPVEYTVEVDLDKLTAAPAVAVEGRARPGVCIRELSGMVVVDRRGVRINGLRAGLGRMDEGGEGAYELAAPAGALEMSVETETTPTGSAEQGRLHAQMEVIGLDLGDPIEDAVNVFSRDAGAAIGRLRASRHPSGRVSASVTIDSPRGEAAKGEAPLAVTIVPRGAEDLRVGALGGVVGLEEPAGVVHFTVEEGSKEGTKTRVEKLSGRLLFNGENAGAFSLSGGLTVGDEVTPSEVACRLRGWRLEGGLTRAVIDRYGGAAALEAYGSMKPAGEFDAEVRVREEADAGAGSGSVEGWVSPHTLKIERHGTTVEFPEVDGRLTFHAGLEKGAPVTGTLEGVKLASAGWSAAGRSEWSYRPGEEGGKAGALVIDAAFDAEAWVLDAGLRSMLPEEVARALDRVSVAIASPSALSGATLHVEVAGGPGAGEDATRFGGTLRFAGLSADLGVPVEDASGTLLIDSGPGSSELLLSGASLRAGGLSLSEVNARVVQDRPGHISIADASGACHGGRLSADASAEWSPDAEAAHPADEGAGVHEVRYRVNAVMSGVNFAPLLGDLAAAGVKGSQEPAQSAAEGEGGDTSRGAVDARLSLEGVSGRPGARKGRGAIRIANGDIIRLPVVLPLLQMSNLLFPSGDRLNYMQSSFFVDGGRVVFEDMGVYSRSIAIVGSGSVSVPGLALDMRFNTRSNRRIPLWSDLFEAFRNELVSTTVTGTVGKPVIRSEPLTGTRRMLGEIVAPSEGRNGREEFRKRE